MSQDRELALLDSLENTFTRYVGRDEVKVTRPTALMSYYREIEGAVRPPPVTLSPQGALRAVSYFFKIPEKELIRSGEFRGHSRPRQILFWILRRRLGVKYEAIGLFVQRHHSSVIYGVKKIDREMGLYRRDIAAIDRIMGASIGVS